MTLGQADPGRNTVLQATSFLFSSTRFRFVAGLLLFEVAFYFAYRYGMQFSQLAAAPFWFPSSILLCALLRSPPRRWWLFILGSLPIRLFSPIAQGVPMWFLLSTAVLDSVAMVLAALALHRFAGNPFRLRSVREYAWFGLIAVLLVPVLTALAGAALRSLRGSDYWLSWEQWFLGNALAELIVTPGILIWLFRDSWKWRKPTRARLVEAALLSFGLILAGYFAFLGAADDFAQSRFYLPVPFLFWAALRFGMPGAAMAMPVVAVFAVRSALLGLGPFSGQNPLDVVITLQNFLLLRAVPVYLVAAVVEQRRDAERSLGESEALFRNMANAAPVLIWMSGPDKLCEFFNKGWLDFTGRTLQQEMGDGWAEGVHPDDFDYCINAYSLAFDARRRFEIEYRLRRHDGAYRWIIDIGVPRFNPAGEFLGYIGSAIDITDQKEAEAHHRDVEHMHRLAIMGELSAAVAHEVRQPMTAINANIDYLRILLASADPPLEEVREVLSDIRSSNMRANAVLDRIRDFLNRRDPKVEPLDINATVFDACRFVMREALRRRIDIRTELASDLPPVLGDRAQLQQLLLNLVVNGMDAMENAPPALRRLTLRTALRDDGGVEIAVVDGGAGIRPEDLPRLFDSFFTTRTDGAGLGLSVARSIVAAHRGKIWAENNSDCGAVFRVSLPAMRNAA